MEEQGTWASRTQKHSGAGYGRPVDRGVWTAKTVKRPLQQPAHPQYANYWAPLTRKRHTMPHSAQPQHTNYWALRTRKRHQQEQRPQRPAESSNPTQHAKGRTGDCPGPRKGTITRRNVTQGGVNPDRISAPPPHPGGRTLRLGLLKGEGGRGRQSPSDVAALLAVGGVNRLLAISEHTPSCCVGPPFSMVVGRGTNRLRGVMESYSQDAQPRPTV